MTILRHVDIRPGFARSDDLRRANTVRILGAIRAKGVVSRTELATLTGLSPATVSTITAALMNDSAVREASDTLAAEQTGRRGRPQVALTLDARAGLVATVALSLNTARFAFYDFTGAQIFTGEARIETQGANGGEIVSALATALAGMIDSLPAGIAPVRQISFGVQGTTDTAGRTMLWSPITKGPVELAAGLERQLGIPVTIANDSDATAIALRRVEPGRYGGDFVTIAMTDGIGMSIMIGGSLFSGVRSSAAEFGHMVYSYDGAQCRCGRRGCIEAYAGDYAILRTAVGQDGRDRPRDEVKRSEFAALSQTALERDGPERKAFQTAARAIGVGLLNVFALMDVAPIALVGFGGAGEKLLEPEIRSILKDSFQGGVQNPIRIDWYPDAAPLISRGAAERGLELLEQRIAASSVDASGGEFAAAE